MKYPVKETVFCPDCKSWHLVYRRNNYIKTKISPLCLSRRDRDNYRNKKKK